MGRGEVLELICKGRQAIKAQPESSDLLKLLQSEITHELSSPRLQDEIAPSGDFTLEWDATHSQDIVLRKQCETGEEVAVSALLGPNSGDKTYPRDVTLRVCIKKPGLDSFLLFDVGVSNISRIGPEFYITSARYLLSTGPREYTGPLFSDLDHDLQLAFEEYLKARGVEESLLDFLLLHMHRKEQNQYLNWLQRLHETVSQGESSSPL